MMAAVGQVRGSAASAMPRSPAVSTADLRKGNNGACRGKLYATRPGAVLVEREMRSGAMVIMKIAGKYSAQVVRVEDDNVIQTFAAD
jgi:hypothetical protein